MLSNEYLVFERSEDNPLCDFISANEIRLFIITFSLFWFAIGEFFIVLSDGISDTIPVPPAPAYRIPDDIYRQTVEISRTLF